MTQRPARLVPLQCLRSGQSARVGRVVGHPDYIHRVEEFGLRKGTVIEVFRSGNPYILRIGGQKVCLRLDDLLNVLVYPDESVE